MKRKGINTDHLQSFKFARLGAKLQALYFQLYFVLSDECGLCRVDLDEFSARIGEDVTEEELEELKEKALIEISGSIILLTQFLPGHHGSLNPQRKEQKRYCLKAEKTGLFFSKDHETASFFFNEKTPEKLVSFKDEKQRIQIQFEQNINENGVPSPIEHRSNGDGTPPDQIRSDIDQIRSDNSICIEKEKKENSENEIPTVKERELKRLQALKAPAVYKEHKATLEEEKTASLEFMVKQLKIGTMDEKKAKQLQKIEGILAGRKTLITVAGSEIYDLAELMTTTFRPAWEALNMQTDRAFCKEKLEELSGSLYGSEYKTMAELNKHIHNAIRYSFKNQKPEESTAKTAYQKEVELIKAGKLIIDGQVF